MAIVSGGRGSEFLSSILLFGNAKVLPYGKCCNTIYLLLSTFCEFTIKMVLCTLWNVRTFAA
jgi:hypothetical protein